MEFKKNNHYKIVDIKEADAAAWALTSPNSKPEMIGWKFIPLEDDEVRVKVVYTSLCQTDVHFAREKWFKGVEYPIVAGHEAVGIVTEVGKKVTHLKVGDKVGAGYQRNFCEQCECCKKSLTQLCDKFETFLNPKFGGFATHFQLPAKMAFKIPDKLAMDKAAPLLCAGVTVFAPLYRHAKKGLQCGIIGIGGLGHLAIQFAKKMGMIVTAFTTSGATRAEELKKLGADYICDSKDLEKLKKEHSKYDILLNCLYIEDNAEQFREYQQCLKNDGTLIQVGLPDAGAKFPLEFMNIVLGQKKVEGSLIGSATEFDLMLKFAAEHDVAPIFETYKWEDFPVAWEKLEHGRPHYRGIVNVEDWSKKNNMFK